MLAYFAFIICLCKNKNGIDCFHRQGKLLKILSFWATESTAGRVSVLNVVDMLGSIPSIPCDPQACQGDLLSAEWVVPVSGATVGGALPQRKMSFYVDQFVFSYFLFRENTQWVLSFYKVDSLSFDLTSSYFCQR